MIHIVTGRGPGLWALAAARLRAAYRQGRQALLLVPEQYTLQAERDALEALEVKGFFRLQVLSPSRLANHVFERAGRDERELIDERGQALTLARVLWELRSDLACYASAREKPGFPGKLLEAISELKGADISPQRLAEWLDAQEAPSPKLRDLSLLYAAYEEAMAGQLADREDRERELLTRLASSTLFDGHLVIAYGFDLLTPPLTRLLRLLAARADSLALYMVMDRAREGEADPFHSVADSVEAFTRLLTMDSLPWRWDWPPPGADPRPQALRHLDHQLLRARQQPYEGPPEGLRLYAGRTPHDEIRQVAQQIHSQLSMGMSAEGIAVYLAQDSYAPLVANVFADYGIPHFVAIRQPLLAQALVRCLLDALRCVQAAAWPSRAVYSYLKSPYSPLQPQQAFQLENYARAHGVRGAAWTRPFTRGGEELAQEMEALRQLAITPVMALRDGLTRSRAASASIAAVLRFLEDIGARGRVMALDERLGELGLHEEAQRAGQVWAQLMELFAQMDQLLGQRRVPLGRFAQWFQAALERSSLATLPPQQYSVQAGLLGQLMARQPHSVYVLGLNAGALSLSGETLIQDPERERISQGLDTRMNLSLPQREGIRLLDFWKALSQAGQQVQLSYALSDDQGKALSPLIELTRIRAMFPRLVEEGGAVGSPREARPFTPATALDEVARLMATGEMSPPWWAAWAWLQAHPDWAHQARGVEAALRGDDPNKSIPAQVAAALHPQGVVSVSRLETYAGCPFRHFVDYGLRPSERKEWELRHTDLGSFYHAAMDGFTTRAMAHPDWPAMDRGQAEGLMDEVLGELTAGWEEAPWADTPRARSRAQGPLNLCRRMAWSLTEGGAASAFRPAHSELRFGLPGGLPPLHIQLPGGGLLRLRGTIDRLDTVVLDEGLRLLRVVDYKSGQTSLVAGDLEAGVQLQLMLYLRAALTLLMDFQPAGAFYQRLADPLVRADSAQEAQKEARKALRLDGVLLADARVIQGMDQAQPPVSLVDYLRKDGSLRESGKLLTREELEGLMDLAQKKVVELARGIFSGHIARAPLVRASGLAECDFCVYQGICRTERISSEPLRRHSRKMDLKQLAQIELEGNHDHET